jgi:xanthine dehydrogenase YagS FAD-binding subunit
MNRFAFANPKSFQQAAGLLADKKYTLPVLKGGGIDLIDRMKEGLTEPDLVVNVRRVRTEDGAEPIKATRGPTGNLRIEATCTLQEIADSKIIRETAPVLAQAVEWAASPQVRNMATAAGNLLQRPRCWYYRHAQTECLKKGGAQCFAVDGENKYHAIFGDGPCHIVHPSNLAPALNVCGGVVHVIGGKRERIDLKELFHMPDKGVQSEHNLEAGEVITHITCDVARNSGFYAVKEKQSFDWPLVAASVGLDLDGAKILDARVCAGAVAPIPWRLPKVEEALRGVSLDDDAALRKACAAAVDGAKAMSENAYKLKLLPVAVRRAVLIAAGKKTEVDA